VDTRIGHLKLAGQRYIVISRASRAPCGKLTPAEQAVVDRYSDGVSLRRIAEERNGSVRTIANQIQSAYRKLGVSSRTELVRELSKNRG
jgi:DNA-binding NarL/FixJ family response regulator